jgi:hypothetical protein
LESPDPYRGDSTMYFEVVGEIDGVETIAVGRGIHVLARLRKQYGAVRWRKRKGLAAVRVSGGSVRRAEVHWFEAHGVGRVRMKIKRFLD